MRVLPAFVYGVLVLIGLLVYSSDRTPPPPALKAATDLPAGRRLATGDILLPGSDRILRHAVHAGDHLADSDFVQVPRVEAPKSMIAFAVPVDPRSNRSLVNTGSQGWLCPATDPKANPPMSIISSICSKDQPECIAVVSLPAARAASIAEAPRKLMTESCR